jgi:hypothetical protein
MKIEKLGVRITEICGAESIEITPDERAEHGVTIKITYAIGALLYGIEQFGQHIDALKSAHAEAAAMAARSASVARGPWDRLEDVPQRVNRVWDYQDGRWDRASDGVWVDMDGNDASASSNKYSPFRLAE